MESTAPHSEIWSRCGSGGSLEPRNRAQGECIASAQDADWAHSDVLWASAAAGAVTVVEKNAGPGNAVGTLKGPLQARH